MTQTILVTGGLGFIGSHTSVLLLQAGYKVVILDSCVRSDLAVANKMRALLTPEQQANMSIEQVDLCDRNAVDAVFQKYHLDSVIHFAAYKAVGESCQQPLLYYKNNLIGFLNLVEVMEQHGVTKLVHSSSATVYGQAQVPFVESEAQLSKATSPYGQTKINIEYMLEDLTAATNLRAIALRYFNPVGAHPSGLLGEELHTLNNIFPYLSAVYLGQRPELIIFGDDYPTKDGTNERDYIHIMDLARGHLLALQYLDATPACKLEAINLGTGKPLSVLEICQAFAQYSDRPINYRVGPRRAGDIPTMFASDVKAQSLLNFKAELSLQQMVEDTIRFLKTYEGQHKQH